MQAQICTCHNVRNPVEDAKRLAEDFFPGREETAGYGVWLGKRFGLCRLRYYYTFFTSCYCIYGILHDDYTLVCSVYHAAVGLLDRFPVQGSGVSQVELGEVSGVLKPSRRS